MRKFNEHLILSSSTIKEALIKLDILAKDSVLFVVNNDNKLLGSLTDGDIRRGLLKGMKMNEKLVKIIQSNPKVIVKGEFDVNQIIKYRESNYRILPVTTKDNIVIDVVNLRLTKSYLPVDVVIMAGGRGSRLMPLTNDTPKPLLKIGDKAIMERNVDRLISYGINNFWFSVNYLGEQIETFFGNGLAKNSKFNYIWEEKSLGTIGAISKIDNFSNDFVLVSNSDILTNINYESFYLDFIEKNADFSVVSIPYEVNIPYAVLEEDEDGFIKSFKEKPTYRYYSNGGIYLMKKSILDYVAKDVFFNATDLMEKLIIKKKKVISYPLSSYWLDIGQHEDLKKARKDVNQIKF